MVEIELEGNKLVALRAINDSHELAPPPFTALFFNIDMRGTFLTHRIDNGTL